MTLGKSFKPKKASAVRGRNCFTLFLPSRSTFRGQVGIARSVPGGTRHGMLHGVSPPPRWIAGPQLFCGGLFGNRGERGRGICVIGVAPTLLDCRRSAGCPRQPSAGGDAVQSRGVVSRPWPASAQGLGSEQTAIPLNPVNTWECTQGWPKQGRGELMGAAV